MKKLVVIIVFLLIIDIIMIVYNYYFVYHIFLNGSKETIVNVNSDYKDPGIRIKYRGKYLKKYKTKNNVNTKKIGDYEVEYTIGKKSKRRKVKVRDIEKPIIKLENEEYNLNYKEEYIEPGFKATDNYDGDITDKVKTTNNINNSILGDYEVVYTVKDSSSNEASIVRKVSVKDNEKPTFTFKNNKDRYAIIGNEIDLNDYEVIDNYDGNITDKVVVSGEVDFNKEGLYKVSYKVSDSNNNEEEIIRKISVQKKNTKGIPVLMYHWFYDDTKGEKPGTTNSHNYISKTEITKQVKYLSENNFYFPTWDELNDYIDGKIVLPEKSVIVTDDDCVSNFFEVAVPVFQEYEVPVTSFCITNKEHYKIHIGEEYLDFQSHTDSLHERKCKGSWDGAVMCSSYETIYEDIKTSISKITNHDAFAYPFGHYNDNTIKALKNNDIKLAFTINNGRVKKGSNKYKLPRVRISRSTTIDAYKKLVK